MVNENDESQKPQIQRLRLQIEDDGTDDAHITKLKKEVEIKTNQLKQAEARDKDARKRRQNKKLILLGAALVQEIKMRPDFEPFVYRMMDNFLTRDYERAYFGLPLRNKDAKTAPPAADGGETQQLQG